MLISEAIIMTTVAILKGIGKAADVVKTCTLVSAQCVPLVSNPLGQTPRQAPLYSEKPLEQSVQKSADVHLWQLTVEHFVQTELIITA